jgi:hypothetical protein
MKVVLDLVGIDGNAFSVLGAFKRAAKNQGWTREEIDSVQKEAMAGDYNHLLATILKYTEPGEWEEESEWTVPHPALTEDYDSAVVGDD